MVEKSSRRFAQSGRRDAEFELPPQRPKSARLLAGRYASGTRCFVRARKQAQLLHADPQ